VTVEAVGVLDTSTLILIEGVDPEALPAEPVVTAVTWPNSPSARSWHRARWNALLDKFGSRRPRPGLVRAAALRRDGGEGVRACGCLVAPVRSQDNSTCIHAMIAATAMANDLPVYTSNRRDFEGIEGLRLKRVPHPDRAT